MCILHCMNIVKHENVRITFTLEPTLSMLRAQIRSEKGSWDKWHVQIRARKL